MIGFILSLIIGGVIGALAQYFSQKDVPGGVIGNIIVGFLGSSLGGWLLGDLGPTVADFALLPAAIGAILVVLIYDLIF